VVDGSTASTAISQVVGQRLSPCADERPDGRDFAVLAVPLVKELIAEAVIMQLGHSAPTARSTSTSRRQDVQA